MVIAGHPGVNSPPDPIDEPDQGRTSRRHGLADLTRGLTLHTSSADSIACFGVVDRISLDSIDAGSVGPKLLRISRRSLIDSNAGRAGRRDRPQERLCRSGATRAGGRPRSCTRWSGLPVVSASTCSTSWRRFWPDPKDSVGPPPRPSRGGVVGWGAASGVIGPRGRRSLTVPRSRPRPGGVTLLAAWLTSSGYLRPPPATRRQRPSRCRTSMTSCWEARRRPAAAEEMVRPRVRQE